MEQRKDQDLLILELLAFVSSPEDLSVIALLETCDLCFYRCCRLHIVSRKVVVLSVPSLITCLFEGEVK
jgi:hypothetical protein